MQAQASIGNMLNEQPQLLRYHLTDSTTLLIQWGSITTFTGDAVICAGNKRMEGPPSHVFQLVQRNMAQAAWFPFGSGSGSIFEAAGPSLSAACLQVRAACRPRCCWLRMPRRVGASAASRRTALLKAAPSNIQALMPLGCHACSFPVCRPSPPPPPPHPPSRCRRWSLGCAAPQGRHASPMLASWLRDT